MELLLGCHPGVPARGGGRSHQRAQEGADGAGGLAQGAVLLEQQGDEAVRLRGALRGRGRLHLGRGRQLPQEPDLHLQHVLSGLLLQPLVQLVGVPLAEPAHKRESHHSPGGPHRPPQGAILYL